MAVRIETDSKVTVFAGSNKRPFVTASGTASAVPLTAGSAPAVARAAPAPAAGEAKRPRLCLRRGDIPDFAAPAGVDREA